VVSFFSTRERKEGEGTWKRGEKSSLLFPLNGEKRKTFRGREMDKGCTLLSLYGENIDLKTKGKKRANSV